MLGLDAREVFFLDDGVVLVEGQQDVLDYERLATQCRTSMKGQFYGWGVGGASKMGAIARVLSDLKFDRVAGLLDKGEETARDSLVATFPRYAFGCIPASNVRTKPAAGGRPESRGLLDERGLVRRDVYVDIATMFVQLNGLIATGHLTPGPILRASGRPPAGGVSAIGIVTPGDMEFGEPLNPLPDAAPGQ